MIDNIDDVDIKANLSLNLLPVLVAFAYSWEKKKYTDYLNQWVQSFISDMTSEEKKEFTDKLIQMKIIDN